MNERVSPEEDRAETLVRVGRRVPGGPWFVVLGEVLEEPIYLGPYPNRDVAREDVKRLRRYVAALLREETVGEPGASAQCP
jgi:hypothetical protein